MGSRDLGWAAGCSLTLLLALAGCHAQPRSAESVAPGGEALASRADAIRASTERSDGERIRAADAPGSFQTTLGKKS
jgi:hypothetical protein